jgi:hypothetical protein
MAASKRKHNREGTVPLWFVQFGLRFFGGHFFFPAGASVTSKPPFPPLYSRKSY